MSIQSRSHQYGTVFENWQILDLLGQGSNGKTAVFRLKRIDSHRGQSALKVVNLIEDRGDYEALPALLKKEYEAAREECKNSALQEVDMMADFQGNTTIVDYPDHKFVDWTDESGFGCDMLIRMELLKDLRGEIRSGKAFTESEIIKIGIDICQALILCHGNGIIHRDIKPENIFVNRNGNYKLGDFGISRILDASPLAVASTGIGTPPFMAPEQISGKYDRRVDIYSLGLVLYELSNQSRLPFARTAYVTHEDIARRMAGVQLPSPVAASEGLAKIILKACAYKADDRYQTAQEFLAALSALGNVSVSQVAPAQFSLPIKEQREADSHNPYTTEPALGDSSAVQPVAEPKVVERKPSSYETAPAIADASEEIAVGSTYETVPASASPVEAPKGAHIYETAPAIADTDLPKKRTPITNSVDSSRRTTNDNAPSYSKDGFEIQGSIIKKYTGSNPIVTIPSFSGIDTIGERAFAGNVSVTKVIIPDCIKYIKKEAFKRCSMTEISLGENVYRIEKLAFAECRGLTKLVLPNSVRWIEEYAFRDCMGLVDIKLPKGICSIESTAFVGCAHVKNIVASRGMLSTVRDLFRGSVKITDYDIPANTQKTKPTETQQKSTSEIPNYGRVVKPATAWTEYGGIKMGEVETDYRKMIEVPLGTYPNETIVKDPKGRERVLNHITWIQYKGSEYAVMAQDTGPYSCMYFIFVVKNKQYSNPQFVTDRWRASCVFEEFKTQCAGNTEFKGARYSFKENKPIILVTTKTTGRLSCKYSEMKEIPTEELTTPVSLIAPNNKKYMFDHLDTVTVSNTEYLVVAQPVSETAQLFFIFKKPKGTANHPIFISEGKAMRRAYRSFQERHAGEIDFDDLLEYSVPAATPKKTGGAKHFAQSSAAHQFKDHDSIPEIIEINSKYQIIDSFVFRQVCKGRKAVKQVIIPRTIQKIEANAFAGLVIEEKIVIPHSVSYIGKNAFTLGVNGIVDCEAGSMAYSFCVQNGLRNVVDVSKFKEAGVCQYCGSHFKGLFGRRCSNPNCNKPKDY